MIKKKLCIIGSAGIPANYGGFETLVNYISENISKEYSLYVFCSSRIIPKIKSFNGANLVYINLKANGFQGIFTTLYLYISHLKFRLIF